MSVPLSVLVAGRKMEREAQERAAPGRCEVDKMTGGRAFWLVKCAWKHRGVRVQMCVSNCQTAGKQTNPHSAPPSGGGREVGGLPGDAT